MKLTGSSVGVRGFSNLGSWLHITGIRSKGKGESKGREGLEEKKGREERRGER